MTEPIGIQAPVKVFGLDLSLTSTGVANSTGATDRITTKVDSKYGHFGRIRFIRDQVMDYVRHADLVVVEGLAVHSQTGQHLSRAGLWHLVMERVDAADIPWAQVSPAGLKQYICGKGNAPKDMVLAAVIKRFPDADITGNDQADALVLAAMGADHVGEPMAVMPEAQRKALAKVVWPDV
jgi:crossover junction endodeoxyribonuclease RuvC